MVVDLCNLLLCVNRCNNHHPWYCIHTHQVPCVLYFLGSSPVFDQVSSLLNPQYVGDTFLCMILDGSNRINCVFVKSFGDELTVKSLYSRNSSPKTKQKLRALVRVCTFLGPFPELSCHKFCS